jgi:hypothetical protein
MQTLKHIKYTKLNPILSETVPSPAKSLFYRTSPARRFNDFSLFAWFEIFESRHLIFHWRLIENPDVLVFVRNSKVRDWLWLGKVLAPLPETSCFTIWNDLKI